MRNSLVVAGFSAVLALGLLEYGCTSGDTVSGTGGHTGSGTGGTTVAGQGGSTTTTGTGGSTTTTGTGGSTTTTGTGGSTTTTGTGGSTTTGVGGSSGGLVTCPSPPPGDKTLCDPATVTSPCTKNCGLNAMGIQQPRAQKPCACLASVAPLPTPNAWDCSNSGPCVYPATFVKTCFALTPVPPACPAATISGTTTCTNTAGATCGPLCGSATVPSYATSATATPKAGYCACINGIYQCASTAEWPM